jgi:hypothetical protein
MGRKTSCSGRGRRSNVAAKREFPENKRRVLKGRASRLYKQSRGISAGGERRTRASGYRRGRNGVPTPVVCYDHTWTTSL